MTLLLNRYVLCLIGVFCLGVAIWWNIGKLKSWLVTREIHEVKIEDKKAKQELAKAKETINTLLKTVQQRTEENKRLKSEVIKAEEDRLALKAKYDELTVQIAKIEKERQEMPKVASLAEARDVFRKFGISVQLVSPE